MKKSFDSGAVLNRKSGVKAGRSVLRRDGLIHFDNCYFQFDQVGVINILKLLSQIRV